MARRRGPFHGQGTQLTVRERSLRDVSRSCPSVLSWFSTSLVRVIRSRSLPSDDGSLRLVCLLGARWRSNRLRRVLHGRTTRSLDDSRWRRFLASTGHQVVGSGSEHQHGQPRDQQFLLSSVVHSAHLPPKGSQWSPRVRRPRSSAETSRLGRHSTTERGSGDCSPVQKNLRQSDGPCRLWSASKGVRTGSFPVIRLDAHRYRLVPRSPPICAATVTESNCKGVGMILAATFGGSRRSSAIRCRRSGGVMLAVRFGRLIMTARCGFRW